MLTLHLFTCSKLLGFALIFFFMFLHFFTVNAWLRIMSQYSYSCIFFALCLLSTLAVNACLLLNTLCVYSLCLCLFFLFLFFYFRSFFVLFLCQNHGIMNNISVFITMYCECFAPLLAWKKKKLNYPCQSTPPVCLCFFSFFFLLQLKFYNKNFNKYKPLTRSVKPSLLFILKNSSPNF